MLSPRQKHLIKQELRTIYATTALAFAKKSRVAAADNLSRLIFYPSHRLAYNRIGKAGNSSVLLYIYDAIKGNPQTPTTNYNEHKRIAMEAGQDLLSLSRDTRELRKLNAYIFFTVVRNPWTRTLSAFLEKVAKGESSKYQQAGGFGEDSREGFASFIDFLGNGGLHANHHWRPQTANLLLHPSRYDHICRLEHLADDLPAALHRTGLTLPPREQLTMPHNAEASRAGKVTNASARVGSYYTDSTTAAVVQLFADDFKLGNYSTDPASIGLG